MPHENGVRRTGRNAADLVRERATVTKMIRIFCRDRHESDSDLCVECKDLFEYAMRRLDHCPFGVEKPKCADCSTHCYSPRMQDEIRQVMRYAGPKLARSTDDPRGNEQERCS